MRSFAIGAAIAGVLGAAAVVLLTSRPGEPPLREVAPEEAWEEGGRPPHPVPTTGPPAAPSPSPAEHASADAGIGGGAEGSEEADDAASVTPMASLLAENDLCGLLARQAELKAASVASLLALLGSGGGGSAGDELALRILRSASGSRASRALKELKGYGDPDAVFLRALLLARLFESTSAFPKDDARGKIPDYRGASSLLRTLSRLEPGNAAAPFFRAAVMALKTGGSERAAPELAKAFARERFRSPWRRLVERVASRGRLGSAYFLVADEAVARVARPDYERALELLEPLVEKGELPIAHGAVGLAKRVLDGRTRRGSLAAELERAAVRQLGVAGWRRLHAEGAVPAELPGFLLERPPPADAPPVDGSVWIGPITLFERLADRDRSRDAATSCDPEAVGKVIRTEWRAYEKGWEP